MQKFKAKIAQKIYELGNLTEISSVGYFQSRDQYLLFFFLISIFTLILSFGSLFNPVLSGFILLGVGAATLFIVHRNGGILLALILFLLLYRVVIHYQTETKVFVEVFQLASYACIIAAYLFWLFCRMAGIEYRSGRNYLGRPLFFLIFWAVISLFWTKDILHGIHLCFALFINWMIIQLFVVLFGKKEELPYIFKFLMVASLFIGIIIFASKWHLYEYEYVFPGTGISFIAEIGGDNMGPNPELMRAAGFATANQVAFILNAFIFIALFYSLQKTSFLKKGCYLLLFFFLVLCLVLTGSKGGLIAFVTGVFFILLINPALANKRLQWYVFILILLVSGLTLVMLFGEGRIIKSVGGGKSTELATISFSSRIEAWQKGFGSFNNPRDIILGFGIGSSASKAEILPNMHSFYFSILMDLGIIGAVFFATIILMVFHKLYQSLHLAINLFDKNMIVCLSGAIIAALINGLVMAEFTFHFFWIIIGLIVSLTNRNEVVEGVI